MARTSAEDREAAKTAARRRLKARALPKIEALIARSEADGEARVGKFYRWVLTELRDKDEVYPYVAAEHMWCFPVTVEEFIQSKDFAGAMEDARVWPAWQKELRRMTPDVMCGEAPVDEVILGGASGTGKTWVSILSLLYRLYMLSCFRTPQVLWGMAPTTHMLVPLTSHNRDHRQKMLYLPLRRLVEATPFFKRFVPWDKEKDSELYFTNLNVSVKPVTPVAGSLTGSQVFGGILDEMSSMSIVEESKRTLGADGRGGRFDQAEEMYDEVTSRMGRNFTGLGLAVPCVYVLSQTKYTDDFVDKLLARAVKDPRPSVYSRRLMRHQVKPEDVADMARGSTIKVLVGAPGYASRLLEGDEVDRVSSEARIMEVPARYRNQFYDNPDGGLRDVCGISTGVINPFVPNRSAVGEAFRRGERLRPWVNAQNVVLSTDGMPRWVEENMPEDRDAPRFIHVDLSRSKDRCGVAVVKVDGMQHVHDEEFGVVERAPHITVEVAVTIKPSGTHQIDPGDVRSWLMELGTRYGINIGGVSYDGFDSHESIMRWRGAGVRNVREISMDRTTEAYEGLRRALYSGRVDLVENDVLRTEIIELEYNSAKDKVDHPPRGSKDLADAVAGAMKNASEARGVRGQAGYVDSDTGERVKVRRARDNKERPQGRRTRRVGLQDRVDRMARGEPDPWDLK